MQLTAAEEERLQRVGIDDTVRARLRQLLRQLCEQEDRGVGAEYRWGVAQVVEASIGAHVVARCVEAILEDRGRISASMTSWPAVRIPAHGALRSRVASWMNEFRWVVVQAFERELGAALQDLTGCPPAWEVLVVRVGKHGRQLAGPGRVAVALVPVALPYLGVLAMVLPFLLDLLTHFNLLGYLDLLSCLHKLLGVGLPLFYLCLRSQSHQMAYLDLVDYLHVIRRVGLLL